MNEIRLRRLAYSDLPAVLAIERRSFQTPWSLAMFVLELSKPSGICLAAVHEDTLIGYLVCSRYADVWHLMNIAVHPDHRRQPRSLLLLPIGRSQHSACIRHQSRWPQKKEL